jgi:serine phosphatase RsbU (regulator of sigma subunit)
MKKILVLFFLFSSSVLHNTKAQEIELKLDSLIGFWNNINNDDTSRFKAINDFIWIYRNIDADSCFYFIDLLFNEASLKNNNEYIARSWSLRGTIARVKRNEKKALLYYQKAAEIYKSYGSLRGAASSNNNIALLYQSNNMHDDALKIFKENKKISLNNSDKGLLEVSLLNIGQTYFYTNQYDSALNYLNKSIELCDELKTENNISTMYIKHQFWGYLTKGKVFQNQNKKSDAIKMYKKCITIAQSLSDLEGQSSGHVALGKLFFENKDYELSLSNYLKAQKFDKELSGHTLQTTLYMMYKNYKMLNKPLKALKSIDMYLSVNDSLEEMNSNNELLKLKMDKEFLLLKEIDSIKHANEIILNQAEIVSGKQKRNGLIIIVIIIFISLIFLYNQFNKTRKQKSVIESKQKEIKDSISYAKKIQDAIMTSKIYIEDVIPKSFIFFQPKDVVSGDFYWVYKSAKNEIFIVVADCTGHGVPGAFMSMIGNSLLNEIIIEKKIEDTAEILNSLREQIIKSLKQNDEVSETKDGMDMSLCKYTPKSKKVEFSGAYNSLFHVSNDELKTIKGDSQPVSVHYTESKPFTKKEIKVKKGDMIYLSSDGFQDQFGGIKDKKYMALRLKNFLKKISINTSQEQLSLLKDEFNTWKGDGEQIDDVCVMGIRIT